MDKRVEPETKRTVTPVNPRPKKVVSTNNTEVKPKKKKITFIKWHQETSGWNH